jgi:isopentenyl diphosphate isomerase/L-lactate dehydrogenase-like FMN-dependent dehydrogenase
MINPLTLQLCNVSAGYTHDLWPFPAINGLDSSTGCSKIACMPAQPSTESAIALSARLAGSVTITSHTSKQAIKQASKQASKQQASKQASKQQASRHLCSSFVRAQSRRGCKMLVEINTQRLAGSVQPCLLRQDLVHLL